MKKLLRSTFILVIAFAAVQLECYAQDQGINFGVRIKGGPYEERLDVINVSCEGSHTVEISVEGAPWLKISKPVVQVSDGGAISTTVNLDLTKVNIDLFIGKIEFKGALKFKCLTCATKKCTLQPESVEVKVTVIPKELLIGTVKGDAHPADVLPGWDFQGLSNTGDVLDCCELLKKVIDEIAASSFGKTPRGSKIADKLKNKYLNNNCRRIRFIPTVDTVNKQGKVTQSTATVDGESQKPGNAEYVLEIGSGPVADTFKTENIYVGINQSVADIICAAKNASDYYIFRCDGKLGIFNRADLISTIVHEGLHAVQAGGYNVPAPAGGKGSSIEEELDGFKAGNEVLKAFGLPENKTDTAGKGYGKGSNKNYKPLE